RQDPQGDRRTTWHVPESPRLTSSTLGVPCYNVGSLTRSASVVSASPAMASASDGTLHLARSASLTDGSTFHRSRLPPAITHCVPYFCGLPSCLSWRSSAAAASHLASSLSGSRSRAVSASSWARAASAAVSAR